jgi:pimeloyl-ACP methyl ester carboxylesterase
MRLIMIILAGGVITLVLAAGLFLALTWAPEKSVEELKARWAQPPSQFVEAAGMKIHVRDEGPRDDPAPLVLMHGTGSSLHAWDGWVDALKDRKRIIRFDLPGFGLTGPSPDNKYSVDNDVRVVFALLDAMGVQRVMTGGNSLGGAGAAGPRRKAYPRRCGRLPVPLDLGADRLSAAAYSRRQLADAAHAAAIPGGARREQGIRRSVARNTGADRALDRAHPARG